MSDLSEKAMINIEDAIRQFQANLIAGIPSAPNILKYKTAFVDKSAQYISNK